MRPRAPHLTVVQQSRRKAGEAGFGCPYIPVPTSTGIILLERSTGAFPAFPALSQAGSLTHTHMHTRWHTHAHDGFLLQGYCGAVLLLLTSAERRPPTREQADCGTEGSHHHLGFGRAPRAGRAVAKLHSGNLGRSPAVPGRGLAPGSCGPLMRSRHPTWLVRGTHLAFSGWPRIRNREKKLGNLSVIRQTLFIWG